VATVPDTIIVAGITGGITLLGYFFGRRKNAAEVADKFSDAWGKLSNAQDAFQEQMEVRLKVLNERIAAQDGIIASQNRTIAEQNGTIASQQQHIAAQDKVIAEQRDTILLLTKQLNSMK
jgi:uncharacterized coiled-coil protein SlyX